jgi:hypothetical protein
MGGIDADKTCGRNFNHFPGVRVFSRWAFGARKPDRVSGLIQTQHGAGIGAGSCDCFPGIQQDIRQKPFVSLDQFAAYERRFELHVLTLARSSGTCLVFMETVYGPDSSSPFDR